MTDSKPLWRISSAHINEFVRAADRFEAWDTLRDRPASDFGLIVSVEPNESADPIAIHTAALMFSWNRDSDAALVIASAVRAGLPDTSAADRATAASLTQQRESRKP